jgi:ribonuclease P protein component
MTPMDKLGTISKTIPVRVSTVAPNKVAKKATERNYLRRKMYEAVKPIYSDIIDGQYIIVFAKVAATTTTFTQLSEEMKNIFVKAGLLR